VINYIEEDDDFLISDIYFLKIYIIFKKTNRLYLFDKYLIIIRIYIR